MTDSRLAVNPLVDMWRWQCRGACRGVDSSVFFHPDHERDSARGTRVARAKRLCSGCPVLTQCRDHALSVQEPYGIWGGMSEHDRLLFRGGDGRAPGAWT